MTLIPDIDLRNATIPIFFDMMQGYVFFWLFNPLLLQYPCHGDVEMGTRVNFGMEGGGIRKEEED